MGAVIDSGMGPSTEPLAQVPLWFAEWEDHLSRFLPNSELCHLNRSDRKPFVVSELLWEVVQTALQVAQWTEGLVTPTVLGALEVSGYDRSFETMEDRVEDSLQPALVGNWKNITCDPATRTICLPLNGRLDLGGIAKGWAAGKAAQRLGAYGPALIDAGGDIAITGPRRDGTPWPIGIAQPNGSILETIMLTSGAVATSGRDYRHWHQGNTPKHHILDPRTGHPAHTDILTVTIIAPHAWQAEAAAKTVLILGSQAGLCWLERHPALAGLIQCADGRSLYSERLKPQLWSEP